MSYSEFGNVEKDETYTWKKEFYFHPGDVARVMNQTGAEIQLCLSIKGKASGKVGYGLIGAKVDPSGEIGEILDGPNHLVALGCQPWNEDEDQFIEEP